MRILALPGDGIGPEITEATIQVLHAADDRHGLGLEIEQLDIGLKSLADQGTTLPDRVLRRVTEVDGTILGPVSHYEYPAREQGGVNPSAELRTRFELFANIRPCRSVPGLSVLREPMDLVIVRENTEGFYSDRNMYAGSGEFMPDPDSAFSLRKVTARASQRVARVAFDLARTRRRSVTAVHKANVVKLSDGLFLREVRRVAEEYPDVELRELIVDATAALLIRKPSSFDVLVTTNMFGDILSDEASELCGSIGLGGAVNAGHDLCVAQAQHGSAPDIAGQGVANPVSLILSAGMLLDWHGARSGRAELRAAAQSIQAAVDEVVSRPETRTRDLGGKLSTDELTRAVIGALRHHATSRTLSRGYLQCGEAASATLSRGYLQCGEAASAIPVPLPDQPTPPNLLINPADVVPFDRGNGVVTIPYVGKWNCASNHVTTGQTQFAPGTGLPLHSHNVEESVLVLEGEAVAEIGSQSFDLVAGQATWVPAGIPHRFSNRGGNTMRIFWVYGGRDVTRTITATGQTFEHLSDRDRGGLSTP